MGAVRDSLGDLVADALPSPGELVDGFADAYSGLSVLLGRALAQPLR
jgi:hypothetical protein